MGKRLSNSSQYSQAGPGQALGSQTGIFPPYTLSFTLGSCKPCSKQITKWVINQSLMCRDPHAGGIQGENLPPAPQPSLAHFLSGAVWKEVQEV